jgi:Tfp pilus assembly protein FimT
MKAYSLIELLITVALLTLIASFIVPNYQILLSQYQLSGAATQTAEFFRLTEQKTVTEQKIYGVTLTANASTITQFLYNTTNGSKTTQATLSYPTNIKIGQVSFSNNTDIRFATSGAPNVSGYVVLNDKVRNRNRKIEIRPSGAVLAESGEY